MAKILISPPSFIGTPLPPISRLGLHTFPLPQRRLVNTRVKFSFQEIPPIHALADSSHFTQIVTKAEALLFTLADAAVATDSAAGAAASNSTDVAVQKNGGWFGFISDAMEVVLKVF